MKIEFDINEDEINAVISAKFDTLFHQVLNDTFVKHFDVGGVSRSMATYGAVLPKGNGAQAIEDAINNKLASPEFQEKINTYVEANWEQHVNSIIIAALRDKLTTNKTGTANPAPYYFEGTHDNEAMHREFLRSTHTQERMAGNPETDHRYLSDFFPNHHFNPEYASGDSRMVNPLGGGFFNPNKFTPGDQMVRPSFQPYQHGVVTQAEILARQQLEQIQRLNEARGRLNSPPVYPPVGSGVFFDSAAFADMTKGGKIRIPKVVKEPKTAKHKPKKDPPK